MRVHRAGAIGLIAAFLFTEPGCSSTAPSTVPGTSRQGASSSAVIPSHTPAPRRCWRQLLAIDGVAPDAIWAIGETCETPIIVRWDGTAWNEEPIPVIDEGYLEDVVAIDGEEAWAVGWSTATGRSEPVLLHRSAGTWASVESPPLRGGILLNGIDAAGPSDVWVVGELDGGPLVLRWDGVVWRRVAFPFDTGDLGSVAVEGEAVWVAEGYSRTAARWDGTGWERFSGPSARDGAAHFVAIAVHDGAMWGVGSTGEAPELGIRPKALVTVRRADRWRVERVGPLGWLEDVSFTPGGTGWAVGNDEALAIRTLAFRRSGDGTWPPESVPMPGREGAIRGVLALDENLVWLVGGYEPTQTRAGHGFLAMRWDGATWLQFTIPTD